MSDGSQPCIAQVHVELLTKLRSEQVVTIRLDGVLSHALYSWFPMHLQTLL
jgi:hypothetical protein